MVYIAIFDRKTYQISSKLFADITAYIDNQYVDEHIHGDAEHMRRLHALGEPICYESSMAYAPMQVNYNGIVI